MTKGKLRFDRIEELLEAILRNQLKLAKAICFHEDIQLEYVDDYKDLAKEKTQ
jgi:hypothetical protein